MRQSVINALKTQLGTTSYSVYEWKVEGFEEAKLPVISIKDIRDDITQEYQYAKHELVIEILAISRGATDHRIMINDIYAAIGTDESLGGTCDSIEISGDETDEEQSNSIVTVTSIKLTARFNTSKWDFTKRYLI